MGVQNGSGSRRPHTKTRTHLSSVSFDGIGILRRPATKSEDDVDSGMTFDEDSEKEIDTIEIEGRLDRLHQKKHS